MKTALLFITGVGVGAIGASGLLYKQKQYELRSVAPGIVARMNQTSGEVVMIGPSGNEIGRYTAFRPEKYLAQKP